MDAPNYVQGLYSVTDRDAIFTKANKYPDAANGLQNQVPTIFPDGTVGWRQIPEGGDGTANANIAVVESTGYASKDYKLNDLLIYNDQLYLVQRPISSGQQIDLLTDVRSTRVDSQLFPRIGKGINLFRNWYFRGGGSQQGGGQLPINQRGLTTYTDVGPTIDGWQQTGGTTTVDAYTVTHTSPAGSSSDFYQIVDVPINDGFYNIPIIFGIMRQSNYFRASAVVYGTSEPVQVFDQPEFSLWLEALSDKRVKAIVRVYAGQSVSLQAAKLELGTHGTLAERTSSSFQISDPPPDYGEELLRCTVNEGFTPLVGKGVNLLDNAYFIGGGTGYGVFPVNQRGNTQYSGTSPAQPAFDRWKVSYTAATPSANGVELVSSGGYGLLQYLSAGRWDLLVGKTVTLSALVTANSGDLKFYSGSTLQATRTGTGVLSATFVMPGGFQASSKFIGIQGNATISAVKLELGSRQTLACQVNGAWVLNDPPPNYQQELAKCQRYLLVLTPSTGNALIAPGYGQNSTHYRFSVPSPVTMIPPTSISKTGRVQILTNGTYTDISDIALLWGSNGNSVNVEVTLSEPLSAFELYGYAMLVIIGGSSIIISAEL